MPYKVIFLLFFSIMPYICLCEINIPNNPVNAVPGKWIIRNGVKKLYDTPLGAAYKFQLSPYFDFSQNPQEHGNPIFNSIQCDISALSANKNIVGSNSKKFLVFEFKIRSFPAVDNGKKPDLYFTITRSNLEAKLIGKYSDINGITYFRTDNNSRFEPIAAPGYSKYTAINRLSPNLYCAGIINRGDCYRPYYDIISIRLIFDMQTINGITSCNANGGDRTIRKSNESITDPAPFSAFGLCIQNGEAGGARDTRTVLDISDPLITIAKSEEELRRLPPLGPVEYPYGNYATNENDIKKNKNPDAIYAQAMRLIGQGKDLPVAIAQLKEAAVNNHILAMYQLGVCYYRGIGVEPDQKAAQNWLRKAVEYDLPDAVALYGLLQIHSSTPFIHISVKHRELLSRALYHLNGYAKKHDNWYMELMFLNQYHRIMYSGYNTSAKLQLWAIFEQLAYHYYLNTIDPEIIKALEDARTKKKPTLTTNNALPSSLRNGMRNNKLPVNNETYRDKRTSLETRCVNRDEFNFQENNLDSMIGQGFTAAMLYKGRLVLNLPLTADQNTNIKINQPPLSIHQEQLTMEDALGIALPLFKRGAQLGNLECDLETMFCQAQTELLKPENFTPETDLKLGDYPLYYMLKYAVEKPSDPGVIEFLNRRYGEARKIWQATPTPENKFMLGAEALYQFFNYGFDTVYYRIYSGDIKDVVKAYELLDQAAAAGVVPAQYLVGKQFIDGQRSNGRESMENGIPYQQVKIGLEWLNKAAQAGHIKAKYLLIKHAFEHQPQVNITLLEQLKPMRDSHFAEAWLLTAEILVKSARQQPNQQQEIVDAYENAAKLGNLRAWHKLGDWYYNKKDKNRATLHWQEFVKRDREARRQDPLDCYYPVIAPLDVGMIKDGRPHNGYKLTPQEIKYLELY